MESVHKTASRPWISKLISVRKFRDDWVEILAQKERECIKLKDVVDAEEYAAIEEECGAAAMSCLYQHSIDLSSEIMIPENVDLETLRLQKEDLKKRKEDSQYEAVVYNNIRFNNYPHQSTSACQVSSSEMFLPVEVPEVVLTVQIFRPQKRNTFKSSGLSTPSFYVDQEFIVLGSQYLTELRDKIECVSDKAVPGDYSENPHMPVEVYCKDLYKSGFFYIDGIFYDDMRHPDCREYSENIIKWTKTKGRGIGPFHKCRMESTRFIDLELQLGYPYVYIHQGNCEHFIVFNDLVMHGPHHSKNRAEYPLHVALKPKKRVFCMVCHIHTADWIVYNNKRLPENPFYFCKSCFFGFNYDRNDKKIGEFEAYHHVDRSTIL